MDSRNDNNNGLCEIKHTTQRQGNGGSKINTIVTSINGDISCFRCSCMITIVYITVNKVLRYQHDAYLESTSSYMLGVSILQSSGGGNPKGLNSYPKLATVALGLREKKLK